MFETKDTGGTPVAEGAAPVQMLLQRCQSDTALRSRLGLHSTHPCGQHAAWLLPSSAHCWPLRQQTPTKAEPLSSQLKKPPGQLTARCNGANPMKLASARVACVSVPLRVGDVVIVDVAVACARLGEADAQTPKTATAAVRRILVRWKDERQQCRWPSVALAG